MSAILITGMSATGKSTLLGELALRNYQTIDTDYNGWCIPSSDGSELVWDELKMTQLLSYTGHQKLIISGCVPNQGIFYDQFLAVVLLSAPTDVIMERLLTRTTNDFGKKAEERAKILSDIAEIEPLLRSSATIELDTTVPVHKLADIIEKLFDDAHLN